MFNLISHEQLFLYFLAPKANHERANIKYPLNRVTVDDLGKEVLSN